MKKIKVYVYGAGNEYNKFKSYMSAYKDRIQVVAIVTTNKLSKEMIDGYPCIMAKDMQLYDIDYIIIAIEKWKEIVTYLVNMGINSEIFIPSKVFSLPYFDLETYINLKKEKVTILSNSCLGAFIYEELGLEYNSPTISAGCWGKEFLYFLDNYKYFLDMDMEVYTGKCDYKKNPYIMDHMMLKGILDNKIIWDFPHDTDIEKTVEKWNYRRHRCNLDNIAVVMVIHTDEDAGRFEEMPFEKKIGIYFNNLNLDSVVYCSEWNNIDVRHRYFYDWGRYAIDTMCRVYGNAGKIDWIKFLLGKKDYIRF